MTNYAIIISLIFSISSLIGMPPQDQLKPLDGNDTSLTLEQFLETALSRSYEFNTICQMSLFPPYYHKETFEYYASFYEDGIITWNFFKKIINESLELYQKQTLEGQNWIDDKNNRNVFLLKNGPTGFYMEARKVTNDTHIIAVGDLHGNLHSLIRIIYDWMDKQLITKDGIVSPQTRIVFTGDIGDRGHYSVELLTLVLFLKLKNPHNIILLQGNHEQEDIAYTYGLWAEIAYKFMTNAQEVEQYYSTIAQLFKLLPQACFIGSQDPKIIDPNNLASCPIKFLMFCHAGLPIYRFRQNQENSLFDEKLIPQTHQSVIYSTWNVDVKPLLCNACTQEYDTPCYLFVQKPRENGLTWNGFTSNPHLQQSAILPGARTDCDLIMHGTTVCNYLQSTMSNIYSNNMNITDDSLNTIRFEVTGIVRGHDHLPGSINRLRNHNNTINKKRMFTLQNNQCLNTQTMIKSFEEWDPVKEPQIFDILDISQYFPVLTLNSMPEYHTEDAYAIFDMGEYGLGVWGFTPYVFSLPFKNQAIHSCWKVTINKKTNTIGYGEPIDYEKESDVDYSDE